MDGAGGRESCERVAVTDNKKQEPHTKMWEIPSAKVPPGQNWAQDQTVARLCNISDNNKLGDQQHS